jgi:FMN-dependent NADH-azoreductase
VTYRDLAAEPLPHLPDATLHWPARLRPDGAEPPAEAVALQAKLIEELIAADVVVIGAPMYNYSLPSSLKAWVDYVHVPGTTAPFDTKSQPMAGRPAVVITARGAVYDEGTPMADWDYGTKVLDAILGSSLGMSVTTIATSLTLAETVPFLADQLDRCRAELAAAHQRADAMARHLATTVGP